MHTIETSIESWIRRIKFLGTFQYILGHLILIKMKVVLTKHEVTEYIVIKSR